VAESILLSDGLTAEDSTLWLTKREADEQLGVSTKSIERAVSKGKLTRLFYRPQNQGPVSIYRRDELAKLKEEKDEAIKPKLQPPATVEPRHPTAALSRVSVPTDEARLKSVLDYFAESLAAKIQAASVPLRDKTFLTKKEAWLLTNLPKWYLDEAIEKKRIAKGPSRRPYSEDRRHPCGSCDSYDIARVSHWPRHVPGIKKGPDHTGLP